MRIYQLKLKILTKKVENILHKYKKYRIKCEDIINYITTIDLLY